MTNLNPKIFSKFIKALSKSIPKWSPDFNDEETMDAWYLHFKNITVEQLEVIFRKAPVTFDEFPSLRMLLKLTGEHSFDGDSDPRDAASRIISAVSKYGYNNVNEAKEYIGELGWETMKRYAGSWSNFCDFLNSENISAIQAQLRELCKTVGNKLERGEISPPGLPSPEKSYVGKILAGLCNSTKQLIGKKK